jgi:hypothetical protein
MMADQKSAEPRIIDDIVDLVRLSDLVDVTLLRVAGERHEGSDVPEPSESMQVLQHADQEHIEVRCQMEVVTAEGRYVADVGSTYDFSEPLQVDRAVLEEFTGRVAVMAVYPFVREAIHQTAARLRLPAPLLGLLRQGQVELTREDGPADPRRLPTLSRD